VAAAPESAGRGVLVTMHDAVFSPRDLTKGATYRVNAFGSPDLGPLGYADADGKVVYYHRSERQSGDLPAFTPEADSLPRVDIVVSYVGADATMVDAAVAAGASGIVSAATGAGRPTPAELEALRQASAAGVVVCQSSRVAGGRVVRTKTTEAAGFVAADNLGPFKARVLLSLALTQTKDPEKIQGMFDRF
jgi:L-asparaginase